MKRFSKIIIGVIVAVLLVSIALLAGQTNFFQGKLHSFNPVSRLPKTPENIPLESFVPEKSFFVASFFPTTPEEQKFSIEHSKSIIGEYDLSIQKFLLSKVFHEDMTGVLATLSIENIAAPLLVSLHADPTKQSQIGFFAVSRLEKSDEVRRKFLALRDAKPAEEPLEETLDQSRDFTVKEENGKIFIEQKNPDLFGLFEAPYLFFSSSPELFPSHTSEASVAKSGTLLQDKTFLEYVRKSPRSFSGYTFTKLTQDLIQKETSFLPLPFFPQEAANITFVSAKKTGFHFSSFAKIPDSKKIDPLIREGFKKSPIALAKAIFSENSILYFEGFNLANQLRIQQKILMDDPFFAVRQGEKFFENLEKQLGFSFEQDFIPMLSRNYAILLEDQKKILPAISLWIDAKANPKSAEKIVKQLDRAMGSFIVLYQASFLQKQQKEEDQESEKPAEPPRPAFELTSTDMNGSSMKQLIIYPERLFQKNPSPLFGLLDEIWHVTYGLTKDNFLVISTRDVFPTKPFSEQIAYQDLLPEIKEFLQTDHVFFDFSTLIRYGERIIELGKSNGTFNAQQLEGIEIIKKILQPIKGFISGTRGRGKWLENKGFLAISSMAK